MSYETGNFYIPSFLIRYRRGTQFPGPPIKIKEDIYMGNTSKERARVCIERPHTELAATLRRSPECKAYLPAAEVTGCAVRPSGSKKPAKKAKEKDEDTQAKEETRKVSKKAKSEKIKLVHVAVKRKHLEAIDFRGACLTLCGFIEHIEDAAAGAKFLLLVFLSQLFHQLVGFAPMLPVICLDDAPGAALNIIRTLLSAVQGPERWQGKNWDLLRPWVVLPKLSLCETVPSSDLTDYIGGTFKKSGKKKRRFCFPYIDCTFALPPNLPASVTKSLLSLSPLSLPIVFRKKDVSGASRCLIEFKASSFISYDIAGIEELKEHARDCYTEILAFLCWFCQKEKRICRWQEDMDIFRPVTRKGRYTILQSDGQTECLCAALSLFRQYLIFASERHSWITQEEAQEIMLQYWRLILPESAPQEANGQSDREALPYDTPGVFYRFLSEEYLPTYREQIAVAQTGTQGTMALIRKMNGDGKVLIIPRKRCFELYAQWLADHNASAFASGNDAAVQRQLMDAGVPLRGEKGNPSTWRFAFCGKDSGKLDCLALPIFQLPEQVQMVLGPPIGQPPAGGTCPNGSETAPNVWKEVKPL